MAQTFSDFELISSMMDPMIMVLKLQRVCEKDKRFRVYSIENHAFPCRNMGHGMRRGNISPLWMPRYSSSFIH